MVLLISSKDQFSRLILMTPPLLTSSMNIVRILMALQNPSMEGTHPSLKDLAPASNLPGKEDQGPEEIVQLIPMNPEEKVMRDLQETSDQTRENPKLKDPKRLKRLKATKTILTRDSKSLKINLDLLRRRNLLFRKRNLLLRERNVFFRKVPLLRLSRARSVNTLRRARISQNQ